MAIRFYDIETLRRQLVEDRAGLIAAAEAAYEQKVESLAGHLAAQSGERPVILLCGPSGSGKTTTAHRLKEALRRRGHRAKTLSMDDYFLPASSPDLPRDENGQIDFESPYRLDIPLLSEQLERISACQSVDIPQYDFPTQSRIASRPFQREPGEFVILEGIHALDPRVTGAAIDFSAHLYISVRRRLRLPDGSTLHPNYIRLMRRLLRDRRERGRSFAATLDLLPSVTRGEEDHILPFKRLADWEIDSFLPYEPALYAAFLTRETLPVEGKHRALCLQLLDCLERLPPVRPDEIPARSLLREFVGQG